MLAAILLTMGYLGSAPPASAAAGSDRLNPGESLVISQSINSSNGFFRLILQRNGNLVLSYVPTGETLWDTGTRIVTQAIMQMDGNFVLYSPSHRARWASDTDGNNGAYIVMQNDGNLVIYRPLGGPPIWTSGTGQSLMQKPHKTVR